VGFLGAGQFATASLIPAIKKTSGIELRGVCTATGVSAHHVSKRYGFEYCTTDENDILSDPQIDTVVIATRHHLHARQVISSLKAGKHVFVEKPLCLNKAELEEVITAYQSALSTEHPAPVLMVGYNRRFAPMARRLKEFLAPVGEPLTLHYRVNAGYIPLDHWVHDPEQGGGRIIGEVCHFVDFLTFLANGLPTRVHARALSNNGRYRDDNVVLTIEFADGSLGTITYVANGDKRFSKERVEVFGGGAVAVLDNFRRLELIRNGRRTVLRSRLNQDKGHRGEWEEFVEAIRTEKPHPMPLDAIIATSLTTFCSVESIKTNIPIVKPR
jgi:predicted dehydrogenase